ncbi:uncharacterized protein [Narcine bancroftii]|uniref:uncharacterized protein isoform X1 n=1 Tax=Narcine bancroftii TaxID=1343680 RepID=UPI0038322295
MAQIIIPYSFPLFLDHSNWISSRQKADTRDLETTKKVLRDACLVNKNDDRRLRQLCPDQVGDINEKVDKLLRDTRFIRNTFDKLNEGIPNITKEIKLRKFIDWYRETGQKYSPNIWFSSCNLTFRPLWENREWKTSNQSIQDSLKSIGGQDLETVPLKDISHPACKETFLKAIFVDIDPLNGQEPKLKQALESGPAAMAVQLPAKTFDQVIKEINQELEERNTSNAALEKQKMLRKCVDRWRKRGWLPGGTEMFLTGDGNKILKRRVLGKLEETKRDTENKIFNRKSAKKRVRDKEIQYRDVLALFEEFGLPGNPPVTAPVEIACRPPPYTYVESKGAPGTPDGILESRPLYPDIETLGCDKNLGNRDTSDEVQAPLIKIEGGVIDVETPLESKKIEKELEIQKWNMKKVQDNIKNLNRDINVLGQISEDQKELMVGVLKEVEKITTTLSGEIKAEGMVIGVKDEKCSTDEETRYDPPWEESKRKRLGREKNRHAYLDIVRTKEKDVKQLNYGRKDYLRDERDQYTFDPETLEADRDSDSDEEESEQGGINKCMPRVKKEQKSPKLRYQCPLLITGRGTQKYVPWSRMDLESLMKKLPPLSNGASPWISCFERETCQEQLALADVRTIMIKLKAEGALKQIEGIVRSSKLGGEIEFNPLRKRGK